ncbi:MAG: MoaD/ThiS family protein [Cryobacterium sp.]|nr:MoaD/ThiS family protein [Oligoflexia bacterium]
MIGGSKKNIEVRYYASLREQAGKESETILTDCRTYGDLYEDLRRKYPFTLNLDMMQVAVDDAFVSMGAEIYSGQRIVFIPPMAGG